MISYALAKELKDAGFPQHGTDVMSQEFDTFIERDGKLCRAWNRIDPEACYVPTLSELIEACGEGFNSLRVNRVFKNYKKWVAYAESHLGVEIIPINAAGMTGFDGDTPQEAVARLWLAVHNESTE